MNEGRKDERYLYIYSLLVGVLDVYSGRASGRAGVGVCVCVHSSIS